MEFQNHAERLAWRANPGNGIALVGTSGHDHMVLCVDPTQAQQERWCRNGAEMYLMPEQDAAAIDGKPWYDETQTGKPVIDLPATAQRARPWLTKAEAQTQIETLCGSDGQNVERLFAQSQAAFWKLKLENNPFPDRAPDPAGAEAARQAIADYTAASAAYQNLVAVLRS